MSFGESIWQMVFNLLFVFNFQNSSTNYRADYFKVFSPNYINLNLKFFIIKTLAWSNKEDRGLYNKLFTAVINSML